MTSPHTGSGAGPNPGTCPLSSGLLQLAVGWTPHLCHQLIQNAAAGLVFYLPKFSHVAPLLRTLHWLPVEGRIHYKTMVLAYGTARGTAPPYLQAMLKPYTPTRALRSVTSGLLALPPLQEGSARSARSKLFSVLVPLWWNQLPPEARTDESLPIFQKHQKPYLFEPTLL